MVGGSRGIGKCKRWERWERIRGSRYKKWYGEIGGEWMLAYLKKRW